MISLLVTIAGVFFKVLQVGARVALNRATIIITLLGAIAGAVATIIEGLRDSSSVLSGAISAVSNFQVSFQNVIGGNEYAQLIGYALSLDVLTDGIVGTFIWVICVLTSVLFTAAVGALIATAPLLSELVVNGLKVQFAKATGLS